MIIDAMDLLYTSRFSGFCIVSSDSDFARLAARVREQGVTVCGFGERKTPRPFITACDKFVYFDVLGEQGDATVAVAAPERKVAAGRARIKALTREKVEPETAATAPSGFIKGKLDDAALQMLEKAVAASADEDGRAHLGRVGTHLAKQAPDFDARNYGFARLSDVAEVSGILDVERVGDHPKVVTVRLKAGRR